MSAPPSSARWAPVVCAPARETRYMSVPVMSSGLPTRPIGCDAFKATLDLSSA